MKKLLNQDITVKVWHIVLFMLISIDDFFYGLGYLTGYLSIEVSNLL